MFGRILLAALLTTFALIDVAPGCGSSGGGVRETPDETEGDEDQVAPVPNG